MTSTSNVSSSSSNAALDQALNFLRAKDDTSRFVGLTLLRSLLDTNEELRSSTLVVSKCWAAIPNRFLIRLLNSRPSDTQSIEEVDHMLRLAVAIVHVFANLLPPSELANTKMTALSASLLNAIPYLDDELQKLAFQVLQCIVTEPAGFSAIKSIGDWHELENAARKHPEYYLKEFAKVYAIALRNSGGAHELNDTYPFYTYLASLNKELAKQNESIFISALAELATEFPELCPPNWPPDTQAVFPVIRNVILSRPTKKARSDVVVLAASLLRGSDAKLDFAGLMFNNSKNSTGNATQPFSYFFINLVLIDIRTTIPSLMETLASTAYSTTAIRLAASFDIASSFILYLLQNLGSDTDFDDSQPMILPPDLILKLRKDFSETFSLTLEFLRDRWEATVTGATGLDTSARIDPEAPLAITWDNPTIPPAEDPIILSGLRATSLWLRDDDNTRLHEQAVGVTDVLVALYTSSMAPEAKVDFRHAVLTIFLGIFPDSTDAVQTFLDQNGWVVLAQDLEQSLNVINTLEDTPSHAQDLIRVLILIVESDAVSQSREDWIGVIGVTAKHTTSSIGSGVVLGTVIGSWHLAAAIAIKATPKLRKAVEPSAKLIMEKAKVMLEADYAKIDQDTKDGLTEVIEGFSWVT